MAPLNPSAKKKSNRHRKDTLEQPASKPFFETLSHKKHRLSVTAVCLASGKVFSASKDGAVYSWKHGERTFEKMERTGKEHLLCLICSPDGELLCGGGENGNVFFWSVETRKIVRTIKAHNAPVTGLCFGREAKKGFLYAASLDRKITTWCTRTFAAAETLYGHQAGIATLCCEKENELLSAGLGDKTVRVWKLNEKKNLVFETKNEPTGFATAVCALDADRFVSGTDTGSVLVWDLAHGEPVAHKHKAHGEKAPIEVLVRVDGSLFASGSTDGVLKIWRAGKDKIECVQKILIAGVVTSLSVSGEYIAVGVGCENRLGRWNKTKSRNKVLLLREN
ncbi:MAG: U3 small nucleolar RNA-interacting protein 2, RRP9 [Amphiamblys sp. WSBS2006]|nr:MAG: U3 small nucleolar RNA-interacting protein 2, RRP9 [Amphiamblys sp. WSBS2006]